MFYSNNLLLSVLASSCNNELNIPQWKGFNLVAAACRQNKTKEPDPVRWPLNEVWPGTGLDLSYACVLRL